MTETTIQAQPLHPESQPLHPKIVARAQAIAEVTRMEQEIGLLHDENERLSRELNRAEDRVTMVLEERDRWRRDATVYRDHLVELATAMSNIGLMTVKAGEIMDSVKELTAQPVTGTEQGQ